MKKQIEGSLRLKLLTLLNLVGLVDFDDQLRISGIPSPKSEPLAIARSLGFPVITTSYSKLVVMTYEPQR